MRGAGRSQDTEARRHGRATRPQKGTTRRSEGKTVDFRDDAQLDASQVDDAGGRGFGIPGGGVAIGGGAIGIIGLIIAVVLGINPFQGGDGTPSSGIGPTTNLQDECRTGADADQSEKCRVVGVVNSIQKYWTQEFRDDGRDYTGARTVLFQGGVQTGCGNATSAAGPFYCPPDRRVYLDLGFFDELKSRFGAEGGPFAQAYVIGHEYGHHVQGLLGTLRSAQDGETGPSSGSVRVELQADCYAGVWAKHGVDTGFFEGPFTDRDIAEALSAAEAVGDDRIQERTQGQVSPEAFTHGTSAQRRQWFTTGYRTGEPDRCDTFSGSL